MIAGAHPHGIKILMAGSVQSSNWQLLIQEFWQLQTLYTYPEFLVVALG